MAARRSWLCSATGSSGPPPFRLFRGVEQRGQRASRGAGGAQGDSGGAPGAERDVFARSAAARGGTLFLLATAAEDLDPAGNERHADGDARWDALVGLPLPAPCRRCARRPRTLPQHRAEETGSLRRGRRRGGGGRGEDGEYQWESSAGAPPLHPRWRDRAAAPGVGARSHVDIDRDVLADVAARPRSSRTSPPRPRPRSWGTSPPGRASRGRRHGHGHVARGRRRHGRSRSSSTSPPRPRSLSSVKASSDAGALPCRRRRRFFFGRRWRRRQEAVVAHRWRRSIACGRGKGSASGGSAGGAPQRGAVAAAAPRLPPRPHPAAVLEPGQPCRRAPRRRALDAAHCLAHF